jgi:enamine deaminase RidA (YjgF/YER057c/UK114 family)
VKNIEDYGAVNQVYEAFFIEKPPARAIVQGALPAGALVEFDAIAIADNYRSGN